MIARFMSFYKPGVIDDADADAASAIMDDADATVLATKLEADIPP